MEKYSVKNVKSFMGMEGYGFNATVYRGNKRIGLAIDEGCGGPLTLRIDQDELDELEKHVKTLPDHVCNFDDPATGKPCVMSFTTGLFISDMVEKVLYAQDIYKKSKNKHRIMVIEDHEVSYYKVSVPVDDKVIADFKSKKPNAFVLTGMNVEQIVDALEKDAQSVATVEPKTQKPSVR